jgi:hypothetical protein
MRCYLVSSIAAYRGAADVVCVASLGSRATGDILVMELSRLRICAGSCRSLSLRRIPPWCRTDQLRTLIEYRAGDGCRVYMRLDLVALPMNLLIVAGG